MRKIVDAASALMARCEPEPNTGCWLWTAGVTQTGYGIVRWGGEVRAHRLAYRIFVGPIPPHAHVLHRCDVPSCINPAHLWLGTHVDNMADKRTKGRCRTTPRFGEDNRSHKFSSLTISEIRRLRADGTLVRELVEKFGVSERHVYQILQNEQRRNG